MNRLTKRAENGMPYLVNVKQNEQELEGSYDTLKCVQEAFEALAQYEEKQESLGELSIAYTELLEEAAEEIENCYNRETPLTSRIREFLNGN